MRYLLIPVLGLALAFSFAGPTSSIANAATYGSSATRATIHTMKPTMKAKKAALTKTHSSKPARKVHKQATTY